MSKKQILGLIGSIILFVGVFTPLVSLPFVGTINYFMNGKGDGTIVLGLAVISLILVLIKKYKGLWFTGLASLAMIAYTFIKLQTYLVTVREQMQTTLAGNPFAGLGDLALQSIQMQWGWAILIIGVGFIFSAVIIKDEHKKDSKEEFKVITEKKEKEDNYNASMKMVLVVIIIVVAFILFERVGY